MIKVVIWGNRLLNWGGGVEFFKNVIRIVSYCKNYNYEKEIKIYAMFCGSLPLGVSLGKLESEIREIDETAIFINPCDVGEGKRIIRDEIIADIIFPINTSIMKDICIPFITYFPDFQEEHFQEFFLKSEIMERRRTNRFVLRESKYIMVTSETVKKDLYRFYGEYMQNKKVFCVPCKPQSDKSNWNIEENVRDKYGIKEDYFIVSNQFWTHKNHLTVIKALDFLCNEMKKECNIVFTGLMNDYRSPEYVPSLLKEVKSRKLEDYTCFLGFIPKKDQVKLLQESRAVIQPTLFEGGAGGFSAQEAISFGKRLLLSDIEINRELESYSGISYFSPLDYKELAYRISEVMEEKYENYDSDKVERLYYENANCLADFYYKMICEVIEDFRNDR